MAKSAFERIDGLERFYAPIDRLDKWSVAFFWVSAFLSFVVLYAHSIPWGKIQDVPIILFSTSVVLHLVISLYTRFYLIPKAEGKRRKQLLSNSFGVYLTPEQTISYYNNPLAPSIRRLGANILENSFFVKAICSKMAVKERLKILIYITIWLIVALWRDTPLEFLVVVTQTVFAGEIISKWVSLEVLRHRNEDLFEELYNEFLHKIDFNSPAGTACILDAFASYEAAKAATAIKQSTTIFNELNPYLTQEWADICTQLGIND